MSGLSAGTFGRAMSSHAVPICVSIMSSSAPGLPPRGLGWRLADCSQLVTKPPSAPSNNACVSRLNSRLCRRPERKAFWNVHVLSSQYFCSFYLNLCGLKFNLSPVSLFVLSDVSSFLFIMFGFSWQSHVNLLLRNTQHFLFWLLQNKSLSITKKWGNCNVKKLSEMICGALFAAIR